jgi:hypothetical protein
MYNKRVMATRMMGEHGYTEIMRKADEQHRNNNNGLSQATIEQEAAHQRRVARAQADLDNATASAARARVFRVKKDKEYDERVKLEERIGILWSKVIYSEDPDADIKYFITSKVPDINKSNNDYKKTFIQYITDEYLRSIKGLQDMFNDDWIKNEHKVPLMKRKLTAMFDPETFEKLKKSVDEGKDIVQKLNTLTALLDTNDEDRTLTNLFKNAYTVNQNAQGGSKHIVKSYKSTNTKITFTKAGKTVTRVVYVNKRGTKAVKYDNKMVHVSKLKIV